MGSDITGTWTTDSSYSSYYSIACTFKSDGTCSADINIPDTISLSGMEGTWSLNGETVGVDASGSYEEDGETVDVSVSLTCIYDDSATLATLTIKSITATMSGETMDIPSVTLQKQ